MNETSIIITEAIAPHIEYEGAVTFKYVDDKGKECIIQEHNDGKLPLFTAITRALVGDNIEAFRPSKIMGYSESGTAAFANPVAYTGTPIYLYKADGQETVSGGSQNNEVKYTFMVPLNMILPSASKIKSFELLNNNNGVCAQATLSDPISTDMSSNLMVYWKLYFK